MKTPRLKHLTNFFKLLKFIIIFHLLFLIIHALTTMLIELKMCSKLSSSSPPYIILKSASATISEILALWRSGTSLVLLPSKCCMTFTTSC